ncbi:MAG: hypothetical protein H0V44_00605, partial [Planctomycetes bacterium]|nr:hypothetical protein [Planctomycetota bacterium]
MRFLRDCADAVIDLLLPSVCPACLVADGPGLCSACAALIVRNPHPCPWCAAPRADVAAACRQCGGRGIVHIGTATVACAYHGVIERLVTAAKASGRPSAVRALVSL